MSIGDVLRRLAVWGSKRKQATETDAGGAWSALQCAYGSAEEVPALLRRMVPDSRAEVWSDLYGLLCHQGTVYSASFAALPSLEAAARAWSPGERLMPLVLAGDIVNSTDVAGEREQLMQPHTETLRSLRNLLDESLDAPGWEQGDYVYLMRARLGLDMDHLWGDVLDGLVDGELGARCPACGKDLVLQRDHQSWRAAEDVWPAPESIQYAWVASGTAMSPPAPWLIEQSTKARLSDLADCIRGLFGRFRCPHCSAETTTSDAVARRWSS
jgi:hypothetical protein